MTTERASIKSARIFSGLRGPEKGLALQTARFLSVFLMGLAAGIVLTHVLQMPFKAALPAPTYVTVPNGIYQLYGPVVGAIEGFALLAALITVLLLPRRGANFYLTLVGTVCAAAMIGMWAKFIDPINQEIASWTAREFPLDWAVLRDRWALLHTIRALLAVLGLSALIVTVLAKRYAL